MEELRVQGLAVSYSRAGSTPDAVERVAALRREIDWLS